MGAVPRRRPTAVAETRSGTGPYFLTGRCYRIAVSLAEWVVVRPFGHPS